VHDFSLFQAKFVTFFCIHHNRTQHVASFI